MPLRAEQASMTKWDWDLAAREITKGAEEALRYADEARLQAEQYERDLRRALEEQAKATIASMVSPAERDAAERLVTRGVRIVDEVGAWLVGRSPVGLAQKLLPELRAGVGELQDFFRARDDAGLPASNSPPAPARPAP